VTSYVRRRQPSYYHGICLDGLNKITKPLNSSSWPHVLALATSALISKKINHFVMSSWVLNILHLACLYKWEGAYTSGAGIIVNSYNVRDKTLGEKPRTDDSLFSATLERRACCSGHLTARQMSTKRQDKDVYIRSDLFSCGVRNHELSCVNWNTLRTKITHCTDQLSFNTVIKETRLFITSLVLKITFLLFQNINSRPQQF
jgi:hypothetical protein